MHASRYSGFTLIETTIVLIIFSLLIAGSMSFFTTFYTKNQNTAVKQRLETVKIAIETYIEQFGALPCPSSLTALPSSKQFLSPTDCEDKTVQIGQCASDGGYCIQAGREDFQGGAVEKPTRVRIGGVPARAINVAYDQTHDPWNNRILYAVTEPLAERDGALSTGGHGAIGIVDHLGESFITPENTAAYVLVSHGVDGSGAKTFMGGAEGRPCPVGQTLDAKNCDYSQNVAPAVFRVGFVSHGAGKDKYDDFILYDTKGQVFKASGPPQCKDMPVCAEENIETASVCQIPGGSDGIPLCTMRQDLGGGSDDKDEYEHDITTWKHACDFGEGWKKPSLSELRVLHENQEVIGGFEADKFYLTRSYYNPGLIENDDRKLEVWAKKFAGSMLTGSKEKTLNLSPKRSDNGDRGYIRCIMR